MNVGEVTNKIECIAPRDTACDFDNVGLLIGDRRTEVTGVVVTLDVESDVVSFAKENNANLIISHHPLIFSPLKAVTKPIILDIIKSDINVFAAHTNLDKATGGLNDRLGRLLGITDFLPYNDNLSRVGVLTNPMKLHEFVNQVKSTLKSDIHSVVGDLEKTIYRVAFSCGGGGGSDAVAAALEVGADCYVTGDLRYSAAFMANTLGLSIVDAGHFETEVICVDLFCDLLKGIAPPVYKMKCRNVLRRI